jgi:hypothetical protein
MTESIQDLCLRLEGRRHERVPHSESLRACVTIEYVLHKTGMTKHEIGKKIVEPARVRKTKSESVESSGLVHRWARGESVPSIHSVKKLEPFATEVRWIHNHPVFPLLRDYPLSLSEVESNLARWKNDVPNGNYWRFFDDHERLIEGRYVSTPWRNYTAPLVERGDLDGFTVIMGLMRAAEAANDSHAHVACAADLYRAFASVARLPWFAKHQRLLKYCVQRAHLRDELSYRYWRVNWDLIESQIKAERYETIRTRRPRNILTSRFSEPRDFVTPMIVEVGNKLEADPRSWSRRNPRRPGFWRERRRDI